MSGTSASLLRIRELLSPTEVNGICQAAGTISEYGVSGLKDVITVDVNLKAPTKTVIAKATIRRNMSSRSLENRRAMSVHAIHSERYTQDALNTDFRRM